MNNIVLKFGGTSVAAPQNWETISEVCFSYLEKNEKPFLVCSALAKVSDALILAKSQALVNSYSKAFNEIKDRHEKMIDELDLPKDLLEQDFQVLEDTLKGIQLTKDVTSRLEAKLLGLGELMSTKIGAAFLEKQGHQVLWLDARKYLKATLPTMNSSSEAYINNTCQFSVDKKLKDAIKEKKVIITQGFICSNSAGDTVLLGRGGSDTSASYFASKIEASRCEIWTDVPGLFTADPFKVAQARLLKKIVYDEAREMASAGAKVLHPRCIEPAKKGGIPLLVKSVFLPKLEGTLIESNSAEERAQIKGICIKNNIQIISIDTAAMWQEAGFLTKFLECFSKRGLSIDLISSSENQVTVTLDNTPLSNDKTVMKNLFKELKVLGKVGYNHNCSSISFVGKNIRSILHKLTPLFEKLEDKHIYLVSQSANDLNITLVMDQKDILQVLPQLHDQLFSETFLTSTYGNSWKEINSSDHRPAYLAKKPWWSEKRQELLELAQENSPLYVYDQMTIENSIQDLKSLKSIDRVFYSMKANNHPKVLKTVLESGLGLECVSINEIEYIFNLFPDIDPKKILFTPNFIAKNEYIKALERDVFVTVDNIFPLQNWPEVFSNKDILLRLDVLQGGGHHKHVITSGTQSKFGITKDDLDEVVELIQKSKINIIGLHTHNGSGIFKKDTWKESAHYLSSLKSYFPNLKYIDLGGGLGVPDRFDREKMDLKLLDNSLLEFKETIKDLEIWLEPGRYICSQAGVLLAKVTQVKDKSGKKFVGIDAGMNTLLRPSLYGAYHEIVNLSQIDAPYFQVADIVGPICESGDTLGFSRKLPETSEGDVLLIDTAGAYGKVMSSHYNLRPAANEVFLEK
ncbi:MAG: bifunctional aspartate kinase/diaminopimelate decarboxylase [Bacteriovoracaceae bacterium]